MKILGALALLFVTLRIAAGQSGVVVSNSTVASMIGSMKVSNLTGAGDANDKLSFNSTNTTAANAANSTTGNETTTNATTPE